MKRLLMVATTLAMAITGLAAGPAAAGGSHGRDLWSLYDSGLQRGEVHRPLHTIRAAHPGVEGVRPVGLLARA